jgi:hypothetical protein
MSLCNHITIINKVKVYLTFENSGKDHDSFYISGIKCSKCSQNCNIRVIQWEYDEIENKLLFDIDNVSGKTQLKPHKYRHYPSWMVSQLSSSNMVVGDIHKIILEIMPSRLTKWVLSAFTDGVGLLEEDEINNSFELIYDFWKSIIGYTRKIILQEKPPVW